MKKVITTAAILLTASTFVLAQESMKPAAGAKNLEVNLTPLGGKPISITNIRFRKFLSETAAFRLGVGVSFSSTKADSVFASGVTVGTNVTSKYKMTKMGWSIKPGYEKHFAGTNRLSPYIGAELELAGQSSKEVNPTGLGAADAVSITTTKNANKGGFFRLGVNAVAGFDCYITKSIYLGSEIGFGFQSTMYSKSKTTFTPEPVAPAKQPDAVSQGSEMNVGPNFNSAIRLGWVF